MGSMYIENNRVVYRDEQRAEVLLGYEEMITNYSRLPLQYLGKGADSLLSLVLDGMETHGKFAAGTVEMRANKEYATIELLVAREHMKTPYELKVLEIGCTSGIMSYHLAELIGRYHENSQLCCVTDIIGNESGNEWVDKISLLEHVPKLSLLVADYDCMPLADAYYDVVIINGTASFEKKDEMLSEAARVLKKDGLLIGYVVRDADMIERIAYKSGALRVYSYLEDRCLLCVRANDFFAESRQISAESSEEEETELRCKRMLAEDFSAEELRDMIRKLDLVIDEAAEKRDLDGKLLFMHYKGKLLDKLVRMKYQ